jgi:hypothetical protein
MTDRPEDAISAERYAEIIRSMAFLANHHLRCWSPILFVSAQERDTELAARRAYGRTDAHPLTWAEAFAMQPAAADGTRRFKNDGYGHTILTAADLAIAIAA